VTTFIIRFINIVLAGLIAGTLIGIWLSYNPVNYSITTYLEHQQGAIRALNTLMPLLGLITIILTLISAFRQKDNKTTFMTLIIAAIFLVISGLVTKFGNQPINKIVMTWNNTNVPGKWTELRDKWWSLHKIRAVTTFIAFCLIVWTAVRKD
jgi:uncharacterized membrane protein